MALTATSQLLPRQHLSPAAPTATPPPPALEVGTLPLFKLPLPLWKVGHTLFPSTPLTYKGDGNGNYSGTGEAGLSFDSTCEGHVGAQDIRRLPRARPGAAPRDSGQESSSHQQIPPSGVGVGEG